jgi:YQGE family putative transporter
MTSQHTLTMHQGVKHLAKTQNALLTSVFFKAIADSLVGLFVPIYLLTHGLNLRQVMGYCVVVYLATFVALLVALKVSQYIGIKKVFVLGVGITAAFYYCLHALVPSQSYLLIALVDGCALGFYFGAYNLLLTSALSRSHESRGYSVLQVAGLIAGVIGPLAGSLFIKQLSYNDLFIFVFAILLVTPIPLFFSKDHRAHRAPLQLSTLLVATKAKQRIDRSVFLQGMLYGAGTIWPLYLYMHYPHIVLLGVLSTVSGALVVVMTYYIGRSVDQHQRAAYGVGSLLYAPTWLTRLLFITPVGLSINSMAASVLAIAPTLAVAKDIFHTAKVSKNRMAHFARIEFYMDLGRVITFGAACLAGNLTAMFIISAIASLGYFSCRPKPIARAARVVV